MNRQRAIEYSISLKVLKKLTHSFNIQALKFIKTVSSMYTFAKSTLWRHNMPNPMDLCQVAKPTWLISLSRIWWVSWELRLHGSFYKNCISFPVVMFFQGNSLNDLRRCWNDLKIKFSASTHHFKVNVDV